jgi:hypothetical protein
MSTDTLPLPGWRSPRPSTYALLSCGAVAGPLYVAATLAQALTRAGFDLEHNRFTSLTTGPLGWVHQLNMITVGTLTMLFALGAAAVLRNGRGATWAPWLIALFGASYAFGGMLTADPVAGFPPGTTTDMAHATLEGMIQNASRSVSTLFLVATCIVLAMRIGISGRRLAAIMTALSFPLVFAAIAAIGPIIGFATLGLAFLMTPWILTTACALSLLQVSTRA